MDVARKPYDKVEYALNCLDPGDLPVCDSERTPMIDLPCCLDGGFSILADGDEEDVLALADEFIRQHTNDFPSSILFYPPKVT